uniref:SAP domain-containing protein n=1 Tax=Moniliophthora roreri TaxID=221103 RepID=A0A0W0FQ10_MONRR
MSMRVSGDPSEDIEYNFPGDGEPNKYKIFSPEFTKNELKWLCKKYKLTVSGNMEVLQGRLKAFSEDHNQWTLLKAGARRTHKGPQNVPGGKKKELKGSLKHHEEWLNQTSSHGEQQGSAMGTSKKGKLVTWAKGFSQAKLTLPELASTIGQLSSTESMTLQATNTVPHTTQPPAFSHPHVLVYTVPPVPSRSVQAPPTPTYFIQPPIMTDPTLALVHSIDPAITLLTPISGHNVNQGVQLISQLESASGVLAPSSLNANPGEEFRTFKLFKGPPLRFTQAELESQDPNTKVLSYLVNIEKLSCTWSNKYELFDSDTCDVKIQGHGIPIMYWPTLFKLGRLLGKSVNEWKWVAEHYIKSTPENFWDKFLTLDDSGTRVRMGWTQITRIL